MARPVLTYNDARVKKLWSTHACLCKRGKEFKWHLLDNLPENWDKLGVCRLAISDYTLTEAVALYNKEIKHFRIIGRKNSVSRRVSAR